jgi:hypothetical protein
MSTFADSRLASAARQGSPGIVSSACGIWLTQRTDLRVGESKFALNV